MAGETDRQIVETLEGRLPVLPAMRPYSGFAAFLWTSAALGSASYAYLVGSSLATIGNTWASVIGYWIGTLIGMALVSLAVGIPSFRTGIDTVDAAKSALGVRGSLIFMVGIVFSCVGWGNILVAMTARSAAVLAHSLPLRVGSQDEGIAIAVAVALVITIWWLASKGPKAVERLTRWCVPGQLLVAALLLILLFVKYSAATVAQAHVPVARMLTTDHRLQVMLAVEFGLNNGFTMTPFLGGLTRLAASRRIVVTPPVLGYATGAGFISGVAALATAVTGTTSPLDWLTVVAGPALGSAIMLFLVVANVAALVAFIYLGGISIQQIGHLSRMPWKFTTALLLLPSVFVAFRTQWMLDSVMDLLTYNGVMFVGITGVLLADYYVLRRTHVDVAHLFTRAHHGRYWYQGGVNWVAMAVVVDTTAGYFLMFNPVTLAVAAPFRFMGAAAPLLMATVLSYVVLSRLVHGRQPLPEVRRKVVEVEL
ncbi:MAG: cytosine permease [Proteobacteria bacterium]|nr:cytosine permease [Pseudomonadota bacterium]